MYQCAIFDRKSQGGNLYATIYWSALVCLCARRVFIVRHVVNGKSRMCSRPLRLKCISNQFKNWFSTAKCTHSFFELWNASREPAHRVRKREKQQQQISWIRTFRIPRSVNKSHTSNNMLCYPHAYAQAQHNFAFMQWNKTVHWSVDDWNASVLSRRWLM